MKLNIKTYYHSKDIPDNIKGDNFFHSKEFFTICEKTPGYQPLFFIAYENERPIGQLLGIIRKSIRKFPPSLIKRCEIYGTGEYEKNYPQEDIFKELLYSLTLTAIKKSFLIEFRNLDNPLFAYKHFRANQYFPINWLRIHNSLHSKKPEERLSSSRKKQIKSGLKNGASIHIAQDKNEIQAFLKLLKKYYASKVRKHFPNIKFFLELVNEYPQTGKIFIVKYKNKIIGGSFCIFSNDNAYLWFSAGLRKSYPRQYPGILAVWGALTYAYDNGYKHMEFMDVGLPFKYYGYPDFILRFGGIQYGTRRWFRFRWKWLNRIITKCYI